MYESFFFKMLSKTFFHLVNVAKEGHITIFFGGDESEIVWKSHRNFWLLCIFHMNSENLWRLVTRHNRNFILGGTFLVLEIMVL